MNSQLDSRLGTLNDMLQDLERFQDNLGTFDAWVQDSDSQLGDIRRAAADTDKLDDAQQAFEVSKDVVNIRLRVKVAYIYVVWIKVPNQSINIEQ